MIQEISQILAVKISPILSSTLQQNMLSKNSKTNSSKNEKPMISLEMRRTRVLSEYSLRLLRLLIVIISIQLSRNKPLISSTSSSRIIHLPTVTSESERFSLSGFSRRIVIDSRQMEKWRSMIQDSPHLLSSLPNQTQRKKIWWSDSLSILSILVSYNGYSFNIFDDISEIWH